MLGGVFAQAGQVAHSDHRSQQRRLLPSFAVHFSNAGALYASSSAPTLAIIRRPTTCPPSIASSPSNCSGSTQPQLVATAWPFVGSTYRSLCSEAPIDGLVVDLYGFFGTSVPLTSLLASATAGCTLLVDPAILQTAVPELGVATTELQIPPSTVLAGVDFLHQLVPLAITAQGSIAGATASNSLQLTIGSY